jgi:hypothetical protein
MNPRIQNDVIRFGLILPMVLAALVFVEGCAMFASHSNPVAGWKRHFGLPYDDNVINKDCQDFIQILPIEQRQSAVFGNCYEDGTGRHAVQIEVRVEGLLSGIIWEYVLIYDQNDKRVKVVKYFGGRYMNM